MSTIPPAGGSGGLSMISAFTLLVMVTTAEATPEVECWDVTSE